MARPERHDADYFPFYAKRGKTLNILQSKYGLEGIGFFTNLMRFLSLTPDHHYCIKDETDRMNFFAEIGIQDESRGIEMIELMVRTGKFDKELWEKHQVIVSEAFLNSLEYLYEKRKNKIITIAEIREKYNNPTPCGFPGEETEFPGEETPQGTRSVGLPDKNHTHNPQSKVKQSKVKESKSYSEAAPPADNPEPSPKPKKSKKPPLREREPENDTERVEKAYIQNWDTLYAEKRVQTPDPVVTWSQTRALLKAHFEKLKPEQIIQAINNGLRDDWILKGGYSLATMLSASVLNRLINAVASGRSPPGLNKKKSLEGLDSW